jgi:hypothetical protein
MSDKKKFKAVNHFERWVKAGPERNLIWLDSAIKFSREINRSSNSSKANSVIDKTGK